MKDQKPDYELAVTHLENRQFITAYNLFINLAEAHKNNDKVKAALYKILAAECKKRQNKENNNDFLNAGELFMEYAKNKKTYDAKNSYLCASKCFLKAGKFEEARIAHNKSRQISIFESGAPRPIVIIEDSNAVTMKIQTYLQKLGYSYILTFSKGKDGLDGCIKLLGKNKAPILLLDMGLPDVSGDKIAEKLLSKSTELQIVIITADEKTTKRVSKTISSGVAAFIQKPFTMDELKKAVDTAEFEYSMLQK